ncbi:MAG: response regulator [Deltaproteobacteria bacterium]|nr:response regulator [Deltaproteobacteria bacterium]
MRHILIADDSQTARLFIRRCLDILGLEDVTISEAVDGADALEQVKKGNFDLLLTDLNMPRMDGQSLLQRVKASPKLTDIPVVVITSAGNPAKEKELVAQGAAAVLNKPISPATLSPVIEAVLSTEEI